MRMYVPYIHKDNKSRNQLSRISSIEQTVNREGVYLQAREREIGERGIDWGEREGAGRGTVP